MKHEQYSKTMNVAFLVYDQVEVLDLNGPLDVFVKANVIQPDSYNCFTVGKTKEPIYTEANTMAVIPTYDLQTCPKPDMIVIPGANPDHIMKYIQDKDFQETVVKWIKNHYDTGTVVFTICTGSMLLSGTGILAGHNITTHNMLLDALEQYNPTATVLRNVRYVDQERLITTAGITAGIDAALYLIGKHLGQETVDTIVKIFEYQNSKTDVPQ
ncbi:transcriptional regulator GlxA family with amidase domain [Chryseobacterium bernardetii]|jgi:transcriptional regulator GlxA family with amidase domain|uniref:DJ-1/PfpI family protein n=2 Tax=Chryseobacterium TaxID=59732 RepID=A0A543EHB2_9FLAO|nr:MULTISPECIES: DJ-1/PfpI family protein [Chryseobacterium]MDR6370971.1 transcriptional regulator GlxA family with amidase domain [Chryseobacterium vietnamense]MDR6441283.1 transcriptional regulator GlxA family with amidase domain [Chryseobacterium bernardetii]TQM20962.1 DJ-1/PfpI family protein [Chryseobacterium aquifrigidense]